MCLCWWQYLLLLRAKTGRESPPSYSLRTSFTYVPIARIYLGIDCSPLRSRLYKGIPLTFIARVLNASCDVSCDYSLSSLFFLSSIFSTLSLHLSYIFSRLLLSRSLFLSTVSRQHKTRRDVSRTIDSNLNWLFNIPACSNWCTYSHWCLSRDHCIREPNGIRITVCAYWRFNQTYTSVVCRWLHEGHVYVLVRVQTSVHKHNGYTTNCSSGFL